MSHLSHFDEAGQARMVDVGPKPLTERLAKAKGKIRMKPETLQLIVGGEIRKGDVLGIARIAGIMAAKRTADLIPLCHPLPITHVEIELKAEQEAHAIHCLTTVETRGQTGVEMEALTATQIALLTIYDMCKAIDRGMQINDVRLLKKSGGKSGEWSR